MSQLTEQSGKELIARVCHDVNKSWGEYINNPAYYNWDLCSDRFRKSIIQRVEFYLTNPACLDSDVHNNWVKEMKRTGWIYGPDKSTKYMTDPLLVSYDELPKEEKFRYEIFRVIVNSIVNATAAVSEGMDIPNIQS